MDLLEELKQNPFVLAPMAGITDRPFRSFMRKYNCGPVITELVSANGLQYNSKKTKKLMQFDQIQHPVGIQIFGERLDALADAAKYVEELGADFVDLNFGCPVKKVVSKGAGSAVLKDMQQLINVLRAVKAAVNIPVTIKVRTGWDANSKNSIDVAKIAYDEGITWMGIHGRTRAQGYSGQADWEYIKAVKENSKIPILGNGDITSAKIAVQRMQESGCDGVMIGRGCLKNPWIFRESLNLWRGENLDVERNYSKLFDEMKLEFFNFHDERVASLQLKKFAAWYSAGYPGAAKFRKTLFQSKSTSDLVDSISEYFFELDHIPQADTSAEPFLMGGHG
ncbi:MAG: tRNA dihydrouridine synthase DusB [Bdellovibrionales bacterium]